MVRSLQSVSREWAWRAPVGAVRITAIALFVPLLCGLRASVASAQAPDTISQRDRVVAASKIFHHVKTFFPGLPDQQFDRDYASYLSTLLSAANDRRTFDMASMALIATLHDSHSWFFDAQVDRSLGQPIGLTVYRWDRRWVTVRSAIATVKRGDVVEAIDGTPTEDYFQRVRKYISASSERDAAVSLFDTPLLFPERFTLTLDGGRRVAICAFSKRCHRRVQPVSATPVDLSCSPEVWECRNNHSKSSVGTACR